MIIPVFDEGQAAVAFVRGVASYLRADGEIIVVYDRPDDTTVVPLLHFAREEPRLRPLLNEYGPGAATALRYGVDHARGRVLVVTTADGSDDVSQIETLVQLVESGSVVAAASRYMRGGRQIGGPLIKKILSRSACLLVYWFGRVGTRDATNSFKAYDAEFVRAVGVESDGGFEMGIELVAKARRARLPVTEIPTTWRERTEGESHFRLVAWIAKYARWFFYSFGPRRPLGVSQR